MFMPDDTLRYTCMYSIIVNEWATVNNHLRYLIEHHETKSIFSD